MARPDPHESPPTSPASGPNQWSLRVILVMVTLIASGLGHFVTIRRLRSAQSELAVLRREVGYLPKHSRGELAASRVPADEPLTYRFRVSVPGQAAKPATMPSPLRKSRYRIAYSTLLPKRRTQPDWYASLPLFPGECSVTVRIAEDPRDNRWKISTIVRNEEGSRRIGTVLPESQSELFRTSHQVLSTGVDRNGIVVADGTKIRLLDDRWLVGGQALLLYGDQAPNEDQLGVYLELQPIETK